MAKHCGSVILRITIKRRSFMVPSAFHALLHLILQQIWVCHHLHFIVETQRLRFTFITSVIRRGGSEPLRLLGSPWVPACCWRGSVGQCGVLAETQGKVRVVALTGSCWVILSQLSSWSGVLAASIPVCWSLKSRQVTWGCRSVFLCISSPHKVWSLLSC